MGTGGYHAASRLVWASFQSSVWRAAAFSSIFFSWQLVCTVRPCSSVVQCSSTTSFPQSQQNFVFPIAGIMMSASFMNDYERERIDRNIATNSPEGARQFAPTRALLLCFDLAHPSERLGWRAVPIGNDCNVFPARVNDGISRLASSTSRNLTSSNPWLGSPYS